MSSNARRREYIAGHQLLRLAAAHALGKKPSALHWHQPEDAAPAIIGHPNIKTGLSHSGGWVAAVLASAATTPVQVAMDKVGIDIEAERARKNLAQLARYSFGGHWLESNNDDLLNAFFQRWTLCEALVKGSDKSLGTQLLRNQQFSAREPMQQGLLLWHTRLDTLPDTSLHLSLSWHQSDNPQGFVWQQGVFAPMATDFLNLQAASSACQAVK